MTIYKLINEHILIHVKNKQKQNSLAQIKDHYNHGIFCVKLGKKVSTYVNHKAGNLLIEPILCKSGN